MISESVVVLFTDVVKSTELASRLSPDAADELRREHFAILRQALAAAGGTEVKNLGDGLMASFTSASAALSCGVAMQQGVDRNNRVQRHSIGLRVGLSCGEVTHDEGDYFGEPVIEAARLCAKCTGGQILAARVVALMAGRRNPYECLAGRRRCRSPVCPNRSRPSKCSGSRSRTSTSVPRRSRCRAGCRSAPRSASSDATPRSARSTTRSSASRVEPATS